MKETNRIEFKQELHPELDIEKEVISFLNYKEGGIIYIGINKLGEADRIEITSAGSLIDGLNQAEFFDGFSVPRNKELMRVYKDLKLVEQLGSGVPRILEYYSKDSFIFTDNFLRIVFQSNNLVTPHVLRLLEIFHGEMNRKEMQEKLGLSDRENFRMNYLQPALENGLVEMLYPDKPKSSKQKYRITSLGSAQLTKQPK